MTTEYVCTLDAQSLKKAEKELNETEKERDGAVESLRQWVQQNNKWLKSPTDTKFLLGFLRNAKFVQLTARKKLVRYWTTRSEYPEFYRNLDTTDPKIVECVRMGCFLTPFTKDKEGRILMLSKTGRMDISGKYTVNDYMRSFMVVLDYIFMDEGFQVNGMFVLEDMTKLTLKHQMFFDVATIKKVMHVWLNCHPVRYKGLHYFNTNPIFEAMFVIFGPLFPQKLKQRLHIHGANLTDVYKYIDKCLMPLEYLPDDYKGDSPGTIEQVIEETIKVLQNPTVREAILKLSSAEYGIDKSLKPNDEELFTESFRKLNVD